MLNKDRLEKLMKKDINFPLKECISVLTMGTPQAAFEELIRIRDHVDKEAYCLYVRILTQTNTHGVDINTMLLAYKDLEFTDVMYEEEIKMWEALPDEITIYRGTDYYEYPPRICWSLEESKARKFYQGQMFKGVISKNDILGLYCSNTDEMEIIAVVPEGKYDDIF